MSIVIQGPQKHAWRTPLKGGEKYTKLGPIDRVRFMNVGTCSAEQGPPHVRGTTGVPKIMRAKLPISKN